LSVALRIVVVRVYRIDNTVKATDSAADHFKPSGLTADI